MAGDPEAHEMIIHLLVGDGRSTFSPKKIDWELVWPVADAERVAPLLYHSTRDVEGVPEWWLERCRTAYHETGILNTLRFQELTAVLVDLRAAGIEAIVLKGAALIELVYGNPAVRPMVDMDLLLHKRDVPRALEILGGRDYQRTGHEIAPGSTLAYENEVLIQKRASYGWQLELHWTLFDSPFYQRRLPESEWWQTAVPVTIDDYPALCLSPEWTLLHLCGHLAFHHQGRGLLWWHDLAALIRTCEDRISWDYVLTQAQAAKMVLPLQHILPRLAIEWGAPIPAGVSERLQAIAPDREEIKLNLALAGKGLSAGQRMLDDAKGLESWPEKARFLAHNLFPSTTYMDTRYGIKHPAARPFYYAYRWLLGLGGVARDFLERVRTPY